MDHIALVMALVMVPLGFRVLHIGGRSSGPRLNLTCILEAARLSVLAVAAGCQPRPFSCNHWCSAPSYWQ